MTANLFSDNVLPVLLERIFQQPLFHTVTFQKRREDFGK